MSTLRGGRHELQEGTTHHTKMLMNTVANWNSWKVVMYWRHHGR